MTDLKWLDSYDGQTTEQLIALADDYRIDSIVLAFEEALQQKSRSVGFAELNEAEATVLAVGTLEREVNNGGYHQFFFNTPEYGPLIVAALTRIGCPKTAEVSNTAIIQLSLPSRFTAHDIQSVLEADEVGNLIEILSDSCDSAFYDSGEAIDDHLLEYIKANRSAIQIPAAR
jgi:hypothetical protein